MPIHYNTIEDGLNKTAHCLFSFLVRIVLCMHFDSVIYLENILLHHIIRVICIITPLEKEMFQSRRICFYRNFRHAACYGLSV